MKAKASPSQLKRAARDHFRAHGFIRKHHFTHEAWPHVCGELVTELDLVFIRHAGHEIFVSRQTAESRPA